MRSPPARLLAVPLGPPAATRRSDRELVAACAAGEIEALGELFDRFHGRVHGFLTRLVGRHADVDDLAQATFLEVVSSAQRFRGDANVGTWLIAIAANLARQRIRANRRHSDELAEPIDERPDPRERAARSQLVGRVERELALLPHILREAFVLCDLEQVRCVDAARLLGVPEGTLARRLHDARVRLRAAIVGGSR